MSDLSKLVRIVTNRYQSTNPLLNFNEKKPRKELQLFLDIQEGKIKPVPRSQKKSPEPAEVRMTRTRLRKKLLNHLFFLNFTEPHLKISHRFEQKCLDLLHQGRILIMDGEHDISEKLLLNALKIAQETEFTNYILMAIEDLRFIYVQTGNLLQYKKISKLLPHYQTLQEKERQAEELYYTVKLEINRSVSAKKNFLPQLEKILAQLEMLWKENKSFYLFELYYKLNIWYQELTNNFGNIVTISSETERLLAKNLINKKRFDDRYNKYIQVYAHLRDRQFETGLKAAAAYADAFSRSSSNWFAFRENYFLLAMHVGRHEIATRLINEVNTNPFFQKLNKNARERWQLYRSYLYFVNPSAELLRQFNYQSFVVAVPEYSKDKEGFNVAILILQYLHFLRIKEIEPLLYRIESLKKYSGRHFKDSFSLRSQLFFKLLMLVVREDLNQARCRRKGRAIADKLADTPPPGDAYAEIEIIPYERLWELILQMLA